MEWQWKVWRMRPLKAAEAKAGLSLRVEQVDGMAMESLAHEAAQGRGGQGKGYHRVLNKLMEWQWKVWRI